MTEALSRFVEMLDRKIYLDEEASDPDGKLAGLYEAWTIAQSALKDEYAPKPGLTALIWAGDRGDAVLSGQYEGSDGIAEGLSAVATTVLELWNDGASGIQIELYRNEGEN